MGTVRIKSLHPASQGPYVVLEAAQFDPAVHEIYPDPAAEAETAPSAGNADQEPTSTRPRGKRGQR